MASVTGQKLPPTMAGDGHMRTFVCSGWGGEGGGGDETTGEFSWFRSAIAKVLTLTYRPNPIPNPNPGGPLRWQAAPDQLRLAVNKQTICVSVVNDDYITTA